MLMKLTLAVNFINIYVRIFCTKFWCQSQNVTRKAAKKDVCTKKARKKTLMKLTLGTGCLIRVNYLFRRIKCVTIKCVTLICVTASISFYSDVWNQHVRNHHSNAVVLNLFQLTAHYLIQRGLAAHLSLSNAKKC